jgi:hypothetical protein
MKSRYSWRIAAIAMIVALLSFGSATRVRALNPESPEVKKMLEKSLKYLETASHPRLGGKCLIGLVFLKHGHGEEHPQVEVAIKACREAAKPDFDKITQPIYDLGIAIIFLCNLDPSKYRTEIQTFLDTLDHVQKPHGGWGYAGKETGDTSMTQYGALSAWEAVKVGFTVPRENVEGMTNWIIRTQDPVGGWGYQGKMPETTGGARVKQDRVTLCLTTAALGSSYAAADLLGFIAPPPKNDDPNIPAVLIPVKNELAPAKNELSNVDPKELKKRQLEGHAWYAGHDDKYPTSWTHYYLYALERYESFREYSNGNFVKDPAWYNKGVAYLKQTQAEDGSWSSKADMTVPDTAFGCLFLMRSMKKSIERAVAFGAGRMNGGQRLPDNLAGAKLRENRLVSPLTEIDAAGALAIIRNPENPLFLRGVESVTEFAKLLKIAKVNGGHSAQEELLNLYETVPTPSRILILRIIGQMDELKHTPVLIAALEDENLHVRREAYENLQRLTKRLAPLNPDVLNSAAERAKLVADWTAWYERLAPPRLPTAKLTPTSAAVK